MADSGPAGIAHVWERMGLSARKPPALREAVTRGGANADGLAMAWHLNAKIRYIP